MVNDRIFDEDKMKQTPLYPTKQTPSYADWALFNMGKELEDNTPPTPTAEDVGKAVIVGEDGKLTYGEGGGSGGVPVIVLEKREGDTGLFAYINDERIPPIEAYSMLENGAILILISSQGANDNLIRHNNFAYFLNPTKATVGTTQVIKHYVEAIARPNDPNEGLVCKYHIDFDGDDTETPITLGIRDVIIPNSITSANSRGLFLGTNTWSKPAMLKISNDYAIRHITSPAPVGVVGAKGAMNSKEYFTGEITLNDDTKYTLIMAYYEITNPSSTTTRTFTFKRGMIVDNTTNAISMIQSDITIVITDIASVNGISF